MTKLVTTPQTLSVVLLAVSLACVTSTATAAPRSLNGQPVKWTWQWVYEVQIKILNNDWQTDSVHPTYASARQRWIELRERAPSTLSRIVRKRVPQDRSVVDKGSSIQRPDLQQLNRSVPTFPSRGSRLQPAAFR